MAEFLTKPEGTKGGKKGFDLNEFLTSPVGGGVYKGIDFFIKDVFFSQDRRRKLIADKKQADRLLMDTWASFSDEMKGTYAASGLKDTYSPGLYQNFLRAKERTSQEFATARRKQRSFLGNLFFGGR